MKPPVFDYHAPTTIVETLGLLATLDNARLLAGGQSLMPMLNMRFAFPDHVVDINGVDELAGITLEDGRLRIGAMTRQRDLLDSPLARRHLPLLTEALGHVGHAATRNRGTVGGSLCHLDPAAELVAVATALDATIEIAGPNGARSLPITAFPLGYMTPALEPTEMVTALRLTLPPTGHGHCFMEFSRRHGDFAIVSAAVILKVVNGAIDHASVTLGGVGSVPLRVPAAETMLRGERPGAALFAAAAGLCADIEAMDDAQVPAWYRRRLATVLVRRALTAAHERAA